jgi:hypothetical protein
VQGCEKSAQSSNVQFKSVPLCTHMTAVRLAEVLYSPVHSNGVRGPDADKAVKDLINVAHTHTHTHMYVHNE